MWVTIARMIMDRVRKNADWWHVKSAIVMPSQRSASYQPNWDAAFVGDGATLRPADIHYLVSRFKTNMSYRGLAKWAALTFAALPESRQHDGAKNVPSVAACHLPPAAALKIRRIVIGAGASILHSATFWLPDALESPPREL